MYSLGITIKNLRNLLFWILLKMNNPVNDLTEKQTTYFLLAEKGTISPEALRLRITLGCDVTQHDLGEDLVTTHHSSVTSSSRQPGRMKCMTSWMTCR